MNTFDNLGKAVNQNIIYVQIPLHYYASMAFLLLSSTL